MIFFAKVAHLPEKSSKGHALQASAAGVVRNLSIVG